MLFVIKFTNIAVQKTRINHQIKAPELRVIDQDGKMLGIMKTSQAIALALEQDLDLVEISPQAQPPVAKLLDYDKFRYQQEKAAKEAKKKLKKISVKNIRLSIRIGSHDLEFKAKKATEFLEDGHKVKVDVVMRGREQAHPQLAFELLKRFQTTVTSPALIESGPSKMGNTVSIILGSANK